MLPQHPRSTHVVGQLLPREALSQLAALARRADRDEALRIHMLKQMWLVVPLGLLFFFSALALGFGAGIALDSLVGSPLPGQSRSGLQRLFALALLALVWIGTMAAQFLTLCSWLQAEALRQNVIAAADAVQFLRWRNSERAFKAVVVVSSLVLIVMSPGLVVVVYFMMFILWLATKLLRH